jgi:hypothetical protein
MICEAGVAREQRRYGSTAVSSGIGDGEVWMPTFFPRSLLLLFRFYSALLTFPFFPAAPCLGLFLSFPFSSTRAAQQLSFFHSFDLISFLLKVERRVTGLFDGCGGSD